MWLDAIATRLGLKRAPPPLPLVAVTSSRVPTNEAIAAPEIATGGKERFAAFHQCLQRFRHLAPRDASVGAFVAWLQELQAAGQWDYADLLEQYRSVCEMTGAAEMPGKWFWRGLQANGCHRWLDERSVDGRRYRPYVVFVPLAANDYATSDKFPLSNLDARRALKVRASARAGTPQRRSARGAYRADIGMAVAHG